MARPIVERGWISLQEASRKYGQARTSFYLWERKGLLHLRRFKVGKPSVFVNEADLGGLLHGQEIDARDQASLNTEALRSIWDNSDDAAYDGLNWRSGKRVKT